MKKYRSGKLVGLSPLSRFRAKSCQILFFVAEIAKPVLRLQFLHFHVQKKLTLAEPCFCRADAESESLDQMIQWI